MPLTTYFQPCPTCGRGLLIPVACLGQRVACDHCRGRFQARDTSCEPSRRDTQEPTVMERANVLLEYGKSRQLSSRLAAFPFPSVSE